MNSIEATTIVNDLAVKKNKILSEAAKTIADYVQTTLEASLDLHTQVMKMCKDFSTEDTVKILAMTLEYIAKRSASTKPGKSGSFKGSGKTSKNSVYGSMGSVYGSFRGGDY